MRFILQEATAKGLPDDDLGQEWERAADFTEDGEQHCLAVTRHVLLGALQRVAPVAHAARSLSPHDIPLPSLGARLRHLR